ncbi:hypothetical protein RDV89_01490 [Nocardioides zeae]|uniref:Lipoprotein n=1 Tax=Nocardioides imazamoxiresistens TaxID=3231893 RepID=A0ABU3PR67_9ACTN|nr:hypothetical protein [Nocardioides zeae]MDT9591722.1 hypothetical protein [Nocardioides zeae]
MKRSILAVPSALVLAAALAACGGGSDTESEAEETRTGPLAGSEFGAAEGSDVEVPLDTSVAASGLQESMSTPAAVVTTDREGGQFVQEIEVEDLFEVEVDSLGYDADSVENIGDAVPHYIVYSGRYLNGAVTQSQPSEILFDVLDAEGTDLDSGVISFGGAEIEDERCQDLFTAMSFGEGAEYRTCQLLFLDPREPATIVWNDQRAPEPVADPVSWPID